MKALQELAASSLNPYSTGSNSNSYREYRIKQGLES